MLPSLGYLITPPTAASGPGCRASVQGVLQHLPQSNVFRLQPLALVHGLVVEACCALEVGGLSMTGIQMSCTTMHWWSRQVL